jgi:hypothetical protein
LGKVFHKFFGNGIVKGDEFMDDFENVVFKVEFLEDFVLRCKFEDFVLNLLSMGEGASCNEYFPEQLKPTVNIGSGLDFFILVPHNILRHALKDLLNEYHQSSAMNTIQMMVKQFIEHIPNLSDFSILRQLVRKDEKKLILKVLINNIEQKVHRNDLCGVMVGVEGKVDPMFALERSGEDFGVVVGEEEEDAGGFDLSELLALRGEEDRFNG